jgi:hypothetical protein
LRSLASLSLNLSQNLSRLALNLPSLRTPRVDPLREQQLRPRRRHPQAHNRHNFPKKKSQLALYAVFQPRISKK